MKLTKFLQESPTGKEQASAIIRDSKNILKKVMVDGRNAKLKSDRNSVFIDGVNDGSVPFGVSMDTKKGCPSFVEIYLPNPKFGKFENKYPMLDRNSVWDVLEELLKAFKKLGLDGSGWDGELRIDRISLYDNKDVISLIYTNNEVND